jgi:hypothetical protein
MAFTFGGGGGNVICASVRHGRAADHVVVHVVDDLAILLRCKVVQHVADVVRIKRGRLRRHPAGEIGVAHDRHAVVADDLLVRHGQVAVAAAFGRKVDDTAARLHHRHHVGGPELGRGASGDQRGGDDDVDIGGKFAELGQLLGRNSGDDGRSIAAGGCAVLRLLEFQEHEFGAHRFDLFGHFGAHVEGIGDRAQRHARADRGQPRHTGAHHQHLRGRDLARCRHLPGEEPAEVVPASITAR